MSDDLMFTLGGLQLFTHVLEKITPTGSYHNVSKP